MDSWARVEGAEASVRKGRGPVQAQVSVLGEVQDTRLLNRSFNSMMHRGKPTATRMAPVFLHLRKLLLLRVEWLFSLVCAGKRDGKEERARNAAVKMVPRPPRNLKVIGRTCDQVRRDNACTLLHSATQAVPAPSTIRMMLPRHTKRVQDTDSGMCPSPSVCVHVHVVEHLSMIEHMSMIYRRCKRDN